MTKRQIIIIASGILILAAAILMVASGILAKEKLSKKEEQVLKRAVKSAVKSPGKVYRSIEITGRLVPEREVHIYAEVGGIAHATGKPFKTGTRYQKGEIMLKINSDEIESSLIAGRSNFQSLLASVIPDLKLDFPDHSEEWEAYLYTIEIDQSLPDLPNVTDKKLKLFLSGRQIYSNFYSIRENETRLAKYIIRAPFTGSLVSNNLDETALVRVGQPLGEFISTGSYELEAGIGYKDIDYVSIGTEFDLREVNTDHVYKARVVRINDRVDAMTQQVKVYARIADPEAHSGIYLTGKLPAESYQDAIEIPVEALVSGEKIFVLKDSLATLQKIDVLFKDNERAIVGGLKGSMNIVIDKHNESLEGAHVVSVNLAQ